MSRDSSYDAASSAETTGTSRVALAPVATVRFDEYTVVGKLGQGGMSEVHLALSEGPSGFRKLVVIKRLFPHLNEDEGVVRMFLDEARLAARLSHPNIVQTLKVGVANGQHFIAMEYLAGQPLHRLVHRASRDERRVPAPLVARIVADALDGLHYAHEARDFDGTPLGVVHRDVSPHNLFVTYDGVTKLLDFGIAKAATQEAATRTGLVKGKFAYIAPEQARGQWVDRRADLWSAGVVLWEAFAGRRLFRAENEAATLDLALTKEVPDLRDVVPDIPRPLADVVAHALQREVDDRIPTAHEMREVLEGWLAKEGLGDGRTALRAYMQQEFGALEREQRALIKRCVAQVDRERFGIGEVTPTPTAGAAASTPSAGSTPVVAPRAASTLRAWGPRAALVLGAVAAAAMLAFALPKGSPPPAAGVPRVAAAPAGASARPEAPAPSDPVEPVELAPSDEPPRLLEGEPPPSPYADRALAPTVVVRILVDGDGHVRDARVYQHRSDAEVFERAALRTARSYRFAPALREGAPIAVWVNWPIRFRAVGARPVQVRIKGSNTIGGALGPDLAQAFMARQPDVAVAVEALGSSTAFAGLFDGTAEIGAASRPVKASELAEAEQLGITLREFVVAYDGIVIVAHRDNPIRELSIAGAARLFSGEVGRWSEVGGRDLPVRVFSRPSYSGTHEFFRERVLREGHSSRADFAPATQFVEQSDALVAAVAADPGAVGYVGFGWVDARDGVHTIAIASSEGEPAVEATLPTIRTGDYPIARPLMLYTRGAPRGAVADFLRFVFSREGQAIVADHGFSPADAPVEIPETAENHGAAARTTPEVHRVYFSSGGTRMDEDAEGVLLTVAAALRDGARRVLVIGHADAAGDRGVNRSLGLARARTVAAKLRELGVAEAQIEAQSAAENQPLESNETQAGRQANRRADVFLLR